MLTPDVQGTITEMHTPNVQGWPGLSQAQWDTLHIVCYGDTPYKAKEADALMEALSFNLKQSKCKKKHEAVWVEKKTGRTIARLQEAKPSVKNRR